MTEDEAKTKLCPRKLGHDVSFGNQDHKCEGSACMAWRIGADERGAIIERHRAIPGESRPQAKPGDHWGYEPADPNSASKGGDWVRYEVTAHGFCGLAGQP